MSLGAIVIGLLLFSYGTNGTFHTVRNSIVPNGTPIGSAAVAVAVLARGTQASADIPRVNYLIESQKGLQRLWSVIYGTGTSTRPIPKVDFSKYQVLGVFAGTQPTGGYAISVSTVRDLAQKRMVNIIMTSPATSCTVTQARTTPYEILTVPSTTLPLTHKYTKITRSCN